MSESFADAPVPELEYDETIPPRPEEEVADVARAVPDPAGHGGDPAVRAVDEGPQGGSRDGDSGPTSTDSLV